MNLVQKEFSYSEYYEEQREYTGPVKRANKAKKLAWEVANGENESKYRDHVKKMFDSKTSGLVGVTNKELDKSVSRFNNKFQGVDPYTLKNSQVGKEYYYEGIKDKVRESKTLKGKAKSIGKRLIKLIHK